MAILAECDICGAQQRVKDVLVGTSVRCKECGVQIKVFHENLITAAAFIEENGQLLRRQPDRKAGPWAWIFAVLVSALVALILAAVVWGITMLVRYI